jgi:alcohol dehydrogenase class IV
MPTQFQLGRLPRIVFGSGSIAELPDAVASHGRRLFLVTGQRSVPAERLDGLATALARHGARIVAHVRTSAEPGPDIIDTFAIAARDADADVVAGIGGGSVLDTAKAVAGLARSGTSVMDHLEGVGRGIPYQGPAIPFIAVPTTAGTGSEATRNAVVTVHGDSGFKRSFRDDRLIATDAIIDPDLLAGASKQLLAANGLDALTQLLEAYVSTRANLVTDALALDGLTAVRDGLLAWHADPNGPAASAARVRMACAALLSGICLANAGLGAVHGLAAPIGALLPIAHGAACGALLVATVRTNLGRLIQLGTDGTGGLARYARVGRILADLPPGTDGETARAALVDLLATWTTTLRIPRLGALGLRPDQIDAVLAGISTSSMSTNPVPLERPDLVGILAGSI